MTRYIPKTYPSTITTEQGEDVPVLLIQEAWIKSIQSNRRFCAKHGIRPETLEYLVREGEWEELKHKYKTTLYRTLAKNRLTNVERKAELIQQAEELELVGVELVLEDIQEQLDRTGDVFVRFKDGSIVTDANGNPKIRKLSKEEKEALAMTAAIREDNIKTLILANEKPLMLPAGEEEESKKEGKIVDLEELSEGEDGDK